MIRKMKVDESDRDVDRGYAKGYNKAIDHMAKLGRIKLSEVMNCLQDEGGLE